MCKRSFRAGTIRSMPRFHIRSRSGPLSYPLSATIRFGFCLGRPWPLTGNPDRSQRLFRERDFRRGRRANADAERYPLAVDHNHPLLALAPLGFPHSVAPPLAGAKLPSMKTSSHSSRPLESSSPSMVCQMSCQKLHFCPHVHPTPTGGRRGVFFGKIVPTGPGLQNPENTFQAATVICPRTTAFFALGQARQQWLKLFPHRSGQKLAPGHGFLLLHCPRLCP